MSVRIPIRSLLFSVLALSHCLTQAANTPFQLQEASIDSIHRGIRSGEVTCKQVVEGYVARARAYNGICTKLVTADGAKGAGGHRERCAPARR